jgi:plasmid segregation protein ParM
MIFGVDCGRSSVKVVAVNKMFHFPSFIGEWRERKLVSDHGENIELEYAGEKYFVGNLAKYESEFVRSMMTDSKVHEDTLLLILTALHKAGAVGGVKVITGVPVDQHTEEEKRRIKSLLIGSHRVKVNNQEREINIERVEVAIEGGSAFWSYPLPGTVRIIDAGSKTVNYVTMQNKRYIDRESGTLPFGFDTNKTSDLKQISNRIAGEVSKKWRSEDKVVLIGGKAKELYHHMSPYFKDLEVMPNHLLANAKGFYKIGAALL